jgi:hypothetical protein
MGTRLGHDREIVTELAMLTILTAT